MLTFEIIDKFTVTDKFAKFSNADVDDPVTIAKSIIQIILNCSYIAH